MTSSLVRRFLPGSLVLLIAWSCGGSGSPTSPNPIPAGNALTAGTYTLTLTTGPASTGVGIVSNCRTTGQDAPITTKVGVTISGGTGSWTGRSASGDLSVSLTASNTVLTGTIVGTAPSIDGGVTVTVGDNGYPATVDGQPSAGGGAGGQVSGWVNLTVSTGSRGCSINTWNLVPR